MPEREGPKKIAGQIALLLILLLFNYGFIVPPEFYAAIGSDQLLLDELLSADPLRVGIALTISVVAVSWILYLLLGRARSDQRNRT